MAGRGAVGDREKVKKGAGEEFFVFCGVFLPFVIVEQKVNDNKQERQEKILFKDKCYKIQGAIFAVYREMGCGFLEAVYQECLEKELTKNGIPFVSQKKLNLAYKGESLQQTYKADLICYGKIIVELKAVKAVAPEHKTQLINYLKATGMKLGLLVNFGTYPKVSITRLVI